MKEGLLISAGELMQLTQEQKKDIIEILRNHTERYPAPKAVLERKENWTQEDAWEAELSFLQKALKEAGAPADLLMILEYILPVDHASRPDLIMLLKKSVACVEFKTHGNIVRPAYATQFIGYRNALQHYHSVCVEKKMHVAHYLVFCDAQTKREIRFQAGIEAKLSEEDQKRILGYDGFVKLLRMVHEKPRMKKADADAWIRAERVRSPKIWEQCACLARDLKSGTKALYSKISNIPFDCLRETVDRIFVLAREKGKKIIFVSGVPGSGKTLVGLITLFGYRGDHDDAGSIYYTGNGALINALSETLGSKEILWISEFRDKYIKMGHRVPEHILIFDEAQRFWDGGTNKLGFSDAEGVLSAAYAEDDVTLLCLIGDGQVPLVGEAGLSAWTDALRQNPSWTVYAPEPMAASFQGITSCHLERCLYLDTSRRQHFADLSPWVEGVLAADAVRARQALQNIKGADGQERVTIYVTRSSGLASIYNKELGKDICQLEEQKALHDGENPASPYMYGLLCSSKADVNELKESLPGLHLNSIYMKGKDAYQWYHGGCLKTTGMNSAPESFCQGLELDFPIILFGGDYFLKKCGRSYRWGMRPSKKFRDRERITLELMKNTYRILLTRATEEMMIVIPDGSDECKKMLDTTYEFFIAAGAEPFKGF